MKNRTIIGIVCILLAIAVAFGVAPIVTANVGNDTTEVLVLSSDVQQGAQITASDLTVVEVNSAAIPSGAITSSSGVIGLYAKSNLYAGDFITGSKLTASANSSEDVFATLDGTKVAYSFTISSYAAGLSGKLENGDVISLICSDLTTGEKIIPEALKYVQVITTTTSTGIDKDNVEVDDDGSFTSPSTITVLVTPYQAELITTYQAVASIHMALVCRASNILAADYLAEVDAYLEALELAEEEAEAEESLVVDISEGGIVIDLDALDLDEEDTAE